MEHCTVEIRVPHDHVVVMGVEADDADSARKRALDLFDAGDHQEPHPGVVLLRDDFEESDGHLYATVRCGYDLQVDASVRALESEMHRRRACALLVQAAHGKDAPDPTLIRAAIEAALAAA
ncbi:MAG: hypothetical protein D6791_15300 [Chloroflexi bacterium]|nr:MAG: hypothetical protein D6791_15300 [Chloroflexota bacterium]